MRKLFFSLAALCVASSVSASPTSVPPQDQFFDKIAQYCGQAFEGKVVEDNFTGIETFSQNRLVMHVRNCTEDRLEIPFHVGDNHSRTWILKKTGAGISLKHDHRMPDGSHDDATMYGGHTQDAGWANAQSFPADQFSKEDFIRRQTPQSVGNTWHMYIYPEQFFAYRLTRPGREMRVDFDLTNPVDLPPVPWGYED
ncbi:hypothetical protein [Aliidiomarina minuta]|uniref:hypothetical protein n=1 Tax=Aliidiomarina minuta TaxID=880057 RepID=UPI0018E59EAA|nr:hypothetical protein [Aliidiomarina minuta]